MEMTNSTKTRILMVDDHPIVREGMAQFLNPQPDLDLCCQAGTADEALATVDNCRPDMAIVDMTLQGDSGLELVRTLRNRHPDLPILVMSMHDENQFAERALRAGANGYLMKLEATTNFLLAIRQVRSGSVYLSAAMHEEISRRLFASKGKPSGPIASLSEREFEILHPHRAWLRNPAIRRKAQPQRQDGGSPPRQSQGQTGLAKRPGSGAFCRPVAGRPLAADGCQKHGEPHRIRDSPRRDQGRSPMVVVMTMQ